jgi:energy-coupling factor transporter ATP-binding protein EcfA2
MEAEILLGCGIFTAAGLAVLAGIEARERASYQSVELHFGRDVTPDAVTAVVDRLSGLHPGARLVLDVRADHSGIAHYLHSDQATLETVRGSLRALLPSVRLEPIDPSLRPLEQYQFGRSIRLRGRLRALRDDALTETSAALLAALHPLGKDERLLLRWVIAPGRPFTVPPAGSGINIETEERKRLRNKNQGSVVRARGLLAVQAGHPARAAHLLGRVSAVLRSRGTAYGFLRTTPLLTGQLKRQLSQASFFFTDRYGCSELAGLLAWPIDAPALPGLTLGTSPQLMPSPKLPSTGRVLGTATWPGAERPIAQPLKGALSHSLVAGPTGVGKSTLMTNLATTDVAAGRGCVLIDGKGDTAEAVLARIPADRQGDVLVLDCASDLPQPGLHLFGSSQAELAADVVLGVLSDLFKESWGPLSERYLRAGLMAVAHDPTGTLADLPYVYTDAAYRQKLAAKLSDPLARASFAAYEEMSAAERQQQLSAAFNKLSTLLGRPIVRTVLGQPHPKLDFREVLRRQQIVVVSLSPMRVGAPAARLIGAVTVFALFQAVQGRLNLPEGRRRPFLVYIDEPKALGDLPMPLDSLLEQARGLGVGLTLAPQSLAQLPKSLREAALTNVATRIVFRQDSDDARLLARDLRGVTPDELGDLSAYEAVARVGLGPGDLAAPVTVKTAKPSRVLSDPASLRNYAASRYGMSLHDVDVLLAEKHKPAQTQAPVGRKRRAG